MFSLKWLIGALEREATVWSEMKDTAAAQFREWRRKGKPRPNGREPCEREQSALEEWVGKARHHR